MYGKAGKPDEGRSASDLETGQKVYDAAKKATESVKGKGDFTDEKVNEQLTTLDTCYEEWKTGKDGAFLYLWNFYTIITAVEESVPATAE